MDNELACAAARRRTAKTCSFGSYTNLRPSVEMAFAGSDLIGIFSRGSISHQHHRVGRNR